MRARRVGLIAVLTLLFLPTALLAHHALATQFDTKRTITLTGAVKKIDWSNPHVRLYLEVRDASKDASKAVTWEVEMGSPNLQMMNGWRIDTYRRGDRVRVNAYPARDGSNVGYGTSVAALSR